MKKPFFLLLLTLWLAGCALEIRTTGFLDRAGGLAALPKAASFAVLENAQAPNPVFEKEIKGKIEKLLVRQGYRIEPPERASYLLAYSYSIQSGLRSSTITSYGPPQTDIVRVPDGKGGVTTRVVTVQGAPSVVPVIAMGYTEQLTLQVMEEARMGQAQKVVWVGETLTSDGSSDLRSDIDYLLVATFRYFGEDTGKQAHVRISPDDPEVMALRREAGSPVR